MRSPKPVQLPFDYQFTGWIDCATTRKRADHSLHLHDLQLGIDKHLCELSAEGISAVGAMSHCSAGTGFWQCMERFQVALGMAIF
jgi:hypothetical protein